MRILVATLALMLALGTTAVAGGWAVTTLDTLPPDIGAGQTYTIGWTIRQHGITPVDVDRMGGTTEIIATSPDGSRTVSFAGLRDGDTGHYAAKVTFPSDGTWTWKVTQGPFQAQSLGTVVVSPASSLAGNVPAAQGAPATNTAASGGAAPTSNPWLVVALLLASGGAAVLLGTRVAALTVRPRSA